ncbi:hypothetical protein B0H14DRAFT_3499608 [Mycena olivaceomarginata]|nr:hypothetical protein B0H14DRAFT_3499608 [Mycena olivaceomarginata]
MSCYTVNQPFYQITPGNRHARASRTVRPLRSRWSFVRQRTHERDPHDRGRGGGLRRSYGALLCTGARTDVAPTIAGEAAKHPATMAQPLRAPANAWTPPLRQGGSLRAAPCSRGARALCTGARTDAGPAIVSEARSGALRNWGAGASHTGARTDATL